MPMFDPFTPTMSDDLALIHNCIRQSKITKLPNGTIQMESLINPLLV